MRITQSMPWIQVMSIFLSIRSATSSFATLRTCKLGRSSSQLLHSTTPKTEYTISCPPTDPETLARSVRKHVTNLDLYLASKPIAAHTAAAFEMAHSRIHFDDQTSIILDSGCGTGRSSLYLGSLYPNACVLGVDKSIVRLERNPHFQKSASVSIARQDDIINSSKAKANDEVVQQIASNVWLIRAELVDFWRCACQANVVFDQHYLLYPNPSPKKSRLQNRWYAHPSFPLLLQSSRCIIVRSNWKQYLEEMALAVRMADDALDETPTTANYARPFVASTLVEARLQSPEEPAWTNFEDKYRKVGEPTYELMLKHHIGD
jgi:tRNA G46 methylase TrmB